MPEQNGILANMESKVVQERHARAATPERLGLQRPKRRQAEGGARKQSAKVGTGEGWTAGPVLSPCSSMTQYSLRAGKETEPGIEYAAQADRFSPSGQGNQRKSKRKKRRKRKKLGDAGNRKETAHSERLGVSPATLARWFINKARACPLSFSWSTVSIHVMVPPRARRAGRDDGPLRELCRP